MLPPIQKIELAWFLSEFLQKKYFKINLSNLKPFFIAYSNDEDYE
jgi:hypothetical protein